MSMYLGPLYFFSLWASVCFCKRCSQRVHPNLSMTDRLCAPPPFCSGYAERLRHLRELNKLAHVLKIYTGCDVCTAASMLQM